MKRLALYGAGQHGRVVLQILRLLGNWEIAAVFDDAPGKLDSWHGLSHCGPIDHLVDFQKKLRLDAVFPAIGNPFARIRLAELADRLGLDLPTLIHPAAIIDPAARIGRGSLIEAGACLCGDPQVGELCIINPLASVNHDCRLAQAAHMAASASLGGDVQIGARSLLGVGSTVAPSLRIGDDCLIAAGAAVLRHVPDHSIVIGNPGRIRRRSED